ncbi:MAG: sigma 54-interacting transcriptional regulator, partial [Deltaproteobacteria bacterium]|nr:sigma 54-interacting transcriptional regulator [Deltaproteobacteria bacterium]
DLDWRVTSFNRAAEIITGIKRKEAIGKPCFEVLRSNMCENRCLLKRAMEARQTVPNQPLYIIRADRKRIPINVTTAILKDAGNRMIGGVMSFRDLTDIDKLQKELQKQHTFEDIVSKNKEMLDIFAILPQIAQSASTVLLEGESGTGKELFARAIHHNSMNASGPFVAVNCSALPDTLIESELFGYKTGAFTDAKKDKPGRFDQAQGGTILLDEIGDISPSVQAKLLRVLERKEYEPLGSVNPVKLDTRIIAATHHHLHQLTMENKFREDLYYRINVVRLHLPPLRDRREDIPLLTHHFIERFNSLLGRSLVGISQEALAVLMLHDWPGNVRELENAMEHAFVMCRGELINPEHFPSRLRPKGSPVEKTSTMTLRAHERENILHALERNQWKKMKTAKELGIDKNTLRRKIIRHGIVKS